jgi:hypothetical protein
MRNALFGIMGLALSISALADGCAVPPPGAAEPYPTLASLPARELQMVLDEYAFRHKWIRHAQALAAGFAEGDRVYGEALKRGNRFDAGRQAQWRSAYNQAGHTEYLNRIAGRLDTTALTAPIVDWILRSCIRTRLWSTASSTDACRVRFAAGLTGQEAHHARVMPVRFSVTGGRCRPWPAGKLSVEGAAVRCVRSGHAELRVELQTDLAGRTEQRLPAPPPPDAGPEPRQEARLSEPVAEAISLHRSLDYRLIRLGAGCPTCGLYAADVRPSEPDTVIVSAGTVSSRGTGWRRCPADLRCGVHEFSPPDNPRLSGCAGVPVCRVWRLAESGTEGADVVQITYQRSESVCVNCGEETDFRAAHRRWESAIEAARTRCETIADAPPQVFRAARVPSPAPGQRSP